MVSERSQWGKMIGSWKPHWHVPHMRREILPFSFTLSDGELADIDRESAWESFSPPIPPSKELAALEGRLWSTQETPPGRSFIPNTLKLRGRPVGTLRLFLPVTAQAASPCVPLRSACKRLTSRPPKSTNSRSKQPRAPVRQTLSLRMSGHCTTTASAAWFQTLVIRPTIPAGTHETKSSTPAANFTRMPFTAGTSRPTSFGGEASIPNCMVADERLTLLAGHSSESGFKDGKGSTDVFQSRIRFFSRDVGALLVDGC